MYVHMKSYKIVKIFCRRKKRICRYLLWKPFELNRTRIFWFFFCTFHDDSLNTVTIKYFNNRDYSSTNGSAF